MSLATRLAEERRARLAAERMLELKQAELHAANRKLNRHARALSEEVQETREEVRSVRSEYQRVQSELGAAHQKVAIAERRLWLSISSIQDGFAFFDDSGRLIAANPAWTAVFDGLEELTAGVSWVRLLQLACEEGIVNTEGEDPDVWRAGMIAHLQSREPEPVVVRLWNDRYVRVVNRRGHGGDVVSLAIDITATVRYQRRLKRARHRAEAANRAKSAFLASMSHEIRTPMNGVVGMADLLDGTALSDEQRVYVDTIRSSAEALLVIINDVLDYSKIEADKLKLAAAPFDLERCIHEVVTLLQPAARDKGLALVVDYDLFLPTGFVGDAGRVRQVLMNLVGNAVKFTARGHVTIRVVGLPEAEGARHRIHLSVEDTGIGIPADKLGAIFDDFSQVEDAANRRFEGTGLGLAISRRLVGLMEGEMWVDSEEGRGSVFGVRLSLPPADLPAQPAPPAMPRAPGRVLLVDDTPANLVILARQMEVLGAEPVCCASGAEALARLDDGVQLILTDHNMPGMDGLELAEAVRATGSQVPVVMLSSSTGFAESDPARGYLAALLQRPVPRGDLFRALAQVLPQEEAGTPPSAPPAFASRRHAAGRGTGAAASACDGGAAGGGAGPVAGPISGGRADGPAFDAAADRSRPLARGPSGPEASARCGSVGASGAVPADVPPRRMRVLAAEDNRTNRMVFERMLARAEIDLRFAGTGEEAVDIWRGFAPDLVFMDISMPGMDGRQATALIRADEARSGRPRVPVVAMTAHALDGDEAEGLAAGLDLYLTKPLRRAALEDALRRHRPPGVADPLPGAGAAQSRAG